MIVHHISMDDLEVLDFMYRAVEVEDGRLVWTRPDWLDLLFMWRKYG